MAASTKWVVLERTDWPSDLNYRIAFYANVPVERQSFYANAAVVSEWKTIPGGDLTQLQSGAIVEEARSVSYPAGTGNGAIVADLDAKQVRFQAMIDNRNIWDRYGTKRNADGTLTQAGVA